MPSTSPWRFLTALESDNPADQELIRLTRADELAIVANMISASRVSLLYSFSGNGKTSLIRAGVVPLFRERGYAVFTTRPRPPWCLDDPVRAFKESVIREATLPLFRGEDLKSLQDVRVHLSPLLVEQPGLDTVLTRLESLIERLKSTSAYAERFAKHMLERSDLPLVEFVRETRNFLGDEARILIICDQFEELFVHFGNTPVFQNFVAELGRVWQDTSLKCHLLFSMREDSVGSMIEFRSAIPDIFSHYFKLNPIRKSQAASALTVPLTRLGLALPEETRDAILADLIQAYGEIQRGRFDGIGLAPPPSDDPFLELPALQVVAERLWDTRDACETPFGLAHYRSLGEHLSATESGAASQPSASQPSPADVVLDHYIDDMLTELRNDARLEPVAWRELRLDCLYLLTDRVRHRRALSDRLLLRELRSIRPSDLDLPSPDADLLRTALEPLLERGVVRSHIGAGGQTHYELAHDFAVRSVVRSWRTLDRARAGEIAVRKQRDQEERKRSGQALAAERRALRLLGAGPMVTIGLALLFILGPAAEGVFWLSLAVGLTTILLAVLHRAFYSAAAVASVLIAAVTVLDTDPFSGTRMGVMVACVALVTMPLYLWSCLQVAHRVGLGGHSTWIIRLIFAEYIDAALTVVIALWSFLILLVVVFDALALFRFGMQGAALLVGVGTSTFIQFEYLRRAGSTVGFRMAGLWIADRAGSSPSRGRMLARQCLFTIWAILDLFIAIPTLLLSPAIIRSTSEHQTAYDALAGTRARAESDSTSLRVPDLLFYCAAVLALGITVLLFSFL